MTARTRIPARGRRRGGWFTLPRLGVIALCLVVLVLVVVVGREVLFPAGTTLTGLRTATVDTGTVAATVTGTGSLVPATEQSISFRSSGVLTEVDVKVGDTVAPDQVLAKIDPSQQQLALTQAQDQLQRDQAQLTQTQNGTALQNAQNQLAQAQQAYNDANAQVSLTNQQDASAVAADPGKVQSAQNALNACLGANNGDASKCTQQQQALSSAQATSQADSSRQQADQLTGQQKMHSAQNAVTNAQTAVTQQSVDQQATLTSEQATVTTDQASLQNAQQNMSYTTLTSPMTGIVTAVNGTVGSAVGGGGGGGASGSSSSSASSGQAAGGGSGGGAGASGAGASSSGTGSSSSSTGSSGGAGFISISDVSSFQVSAPFAETDASRLQPNQQAQLTFDAVSGLTVQGSVMSVAPSATVSSNVTDYAVALALDQNDSRLKQGMTANVTVTVNSVGGAVRVPNQAIQNGANGATVTLLTGKSAETTIPIQTGLVGDTYTEVTSGLTPGDVVVLPQLATASPGAGGGGGGIRFGGGGGGGGRGGLGGG